jgi:hypothetical protein
MNHTTKSPQPQIYFAEFEHLFFERLLLAFALNTHSEHPCLSFAAWKMYVYLTLPIKKLATIPRQKLE